MAVGRTWLYIEYAIEQLETELKIELNKQPSRLEDIDDIRWSIDMFRSMIAKRDYLDTLLSH